MVRQIELSGDPYQMGLQHGQQLVELRPYILKAVKHRLALLGRAKTNLKPLIYELQGAWEETARPTLDMMRGIAEGLSLEWDDFFRYTAATYLIDHARFRVHESQGCTVWAAAPAATSDGRPILAKNRDYWLDHQPLQCLAYASPKRGHRYLYLTSAGSPGVFSSGMNEVGLAVADTHVVSLDTGPGLPRYSIMMEILERYERVGEALKYIQSVRNSGNGTLVLVDAEGSLAVVETGYSNLGILTGESGFVVSTNHFVTPALRKSWRSRGPQKAHGNSRKRWALVDGMLREGAGQVDLSWAKRLMSSHGDELSAICRHPGSGPRSVTISSAIYLPQERQLYLVDGMPCQQNYQEFSFRANPLQAARIAK